jgi:putative addiction module component (TIGR02574 family)
MPALTPDQITRLSPPERLALIGDLWDSMGDADVPLSADQRNELEGRLARFDDDRAHGVEWEKFKAELAARAPKTRGVR